MAKNAERVHALKTVKMKCTCKTCAKCTAEELDYELRKMKHLFTYKYKT